MNSEETVEMEDIDATRDGYLTIGNSKSANQPQEKNIKPVIYQTVHSQSHLKVECTNCNHKFWIWKSSENFNCSKCQFPLQLLMIPIPVQNPQDDGED